MTTLLGYAMWCAVVWTVFKKWQLIGQVRQSLSWPSTDGEVISSSLSSESSGTHDNPNTVFRANIKYSYEVDSRKLVNDKICIGGQLKISLKGKAEQTCRNYPTGKSVRVHYNPNKPSDSVLETREETSWFYLAIGLVLAIVGTLMITNVA